MATDHDSPPVRCITPHPAPPRSPPPAVCRAWLRSRGTAHGAAAKGDEPSASSTRRTATHQSAITQHNSAHHQTAQMLAGSAPVGTPPGSTRVGASVSSSEKNATSPTSAKTPSTPAPAPKLRSCAICRRRKVRCDKQSPCSNCRRANIACVFPSTDRPPRWARRLERLTDNAAVSSTSAPQDANPGVGKVMDRLRNLENLVKELSGQLEQAHAAAGSAGDGLPGVDSPGSSTQDRDPDDQRNISPPANANSLQKQFGRLILQDASRSRYVSSGFWSRVSDEASRPAVVMLDLD